MFLSKLHILNYRNITEASLLFSPKLNCLLGNNGMGKTNLLDAIYYLSFCKSALQSIDSLNIRHDEEFFMIQGMYEKEGITEEVSCGLKKRQRKQFKRNKKEYERLSDHIGLFPLVMIAPSDNSLITGGSDERRKFVDMVLSQYDRPYLNALIQYNNALLQRNTLLKTAQTLQGNEIIGIYEEQMSSWANTIYTGRNDFLSRFLPVFQQFYNIISDEHEPVYISYQSHLEMGELSPQLEHSRQRDLILGFTSKGIHKDDFEFIMSGHPLKKVGSQGQCKSFLVALKLAQFMFLSHISGVKPILLLDDVFDRLDAKRVEQIVSIVTGEEFGQIFLTDTNRNHLDSIIQQQPSDYFLFEVVEGEIKALER